MLARTAWKDMSTMTVGFRATTIPKVPIWTEKNVEEVSIHFLFINILNFL